MALVDTGAAISVMPYSIGIQLGFRWQQENTLITLGGILAKVGARAVKVAAAIGTFPPIWFGFAWIRTDGPPLILGRYNFLHEFDVCFFRSRAVFEVKPK
jgi:hypothetical protein